MSLSAKVVAARQNLNKQTNMGGGLLPPIAGFSVDGEAGVDILQIGALVFPGDLVHFLDK
jgi:hypothetical protein